MGRTGSVAKCALMLALGRVPAVMLMMKREEEEAAGRTLDASGSGSQPVDHGHGGRVSRCINNCCGQPEPGEWGRQAGSEV
jgi:hypothetical protein